ncbi:MAG: glycosyltransferase family 4 protein [Promethearchaeota archaeon]
MTYNVVVITPSFPRYLNDPISPFLFELFTRVVKLGFEIHVVAPHDSDLPGIGQISKEELLDGIHVHRFSYMRPPWLQTLTYRNRMPANLEKSTWAKLLAPFYFINAARKTIEICKTYNIDIICPFWAIPQGLIGILVKRIFNRPLIVGTFPVEIALSQSKYRFMMPALQLVFKKADIIIPNSNFTKKVIEDIGVNRDKLKLVYPGVDPDKFTTNLDGSFMRDKYNCTGDPIILTVCRLVERKGIKYLIDALPSIQKEFPKVQLVIVGDGPETNALMTQAKRLGIMNSTIFCGTVPDQELPYFYAIADVFILPAIIDSTGDTEGLGVVMLEAMASEVPVVASKVGGIPEALNYGKAGILIEQKNPKQIAESVISILSDNELRKSLGKKGRDWVMRTFSWDQLAKKIIKIFLSSLNLKP